MSSGDQLDETTVEVCKDLALRTQRGELSWQPAYGDVFRTTSDCEERWVVPWGGGNILGPGPEAWVGPDHLRPYKVADAYRCLLSLVKASAEKWLKQNYNQELRWWW